MLNNRTPDHPPPSIGFPDYLYPDDATCEMYQVLLVLLLLLSFFGGAVAVVVAYLICCRVPKLVVSYRHLSPFVNPFFVLASKSSRCYSTPAVLFNNNSPLVACSNFVRYQGVPAEFTEDACMYNADVWGPDGVDNGAYPFGDKKVFICRIVWLCPHAFAMQVDVCGTRGVDNC